MNRRGQLDGDAGGHRQHCGSGLRGAALITCIYNLNSYPN